MYQIGKNRKYIFDYWLKYDFVSDIFHYFLNFSILEIKKYISKYIWKFQKMEFLNMKFFGILDKIRSQNSNIEYIV
jgi:hypothetical protein